MKLHGMKLIVGMLLLFLGMPSTTNAHANLERSHPLQDAVLQESPIEIRIQFTEGIDADLSQIIIEDEQGKNIIGTLSSAKDRWLIYKIPRLDDGIYKVKWQVLSVDTHVTEGSYRFSIGVPLEKEMPSETISLDGYVYTSPLTGSSISTPEQRKITPTPDYKEMSSKPSTSSKPSDVPVAQVPSAPRPQETAPSLNDETVEDVQVEAGSPLATSEAVPNPSEDSSGAEIADDQPAASSPGLRSGTPIGDDTDHKHSNEASDSASASQPTNHAEHSAELQGESPSPEWRSMAYPVQRIVEVLIAIGLVGFIFFRYGIWGFSRKAPPTWFSLRNERLYYAIACIGLTASGILHVWMLADQLSAMGTYTAWDLAGKILSSTMIGNASWIRPVLAAVMLGLTYFPHNYERSTLITKILAAGLVVVMFPLTGHAYGSSTNVGYAVISHTLHMLAAAIWFGGLVGIWNAMGSRNKPGTHWTIVDAVILRFSAIALPALVIVTISGIVQTLLRIQSWEVLFQSDYGKLIWVKTSLMLLVISIGVLHRRVFIPRMMARSIHANSDDQQATHRFLLGVRLEIIIALIIFVLSGMLSTTAPPAQNFPAESSYGHIIGDHLNV